MSFISKRMQDFESSGIRKIFDMAKNLKNPINLSIGQPHFNLPAPMKVAAKQAIFNDDNSYTQTQGSKALIELIKDQIKKERKTDLLNQDLIITSGVSGGIFLTLSVLLNQGDEVIITDPYFVMYKQLALWLGAKVVYLNTYPDFSIKIDQLKSLVTSKTKAIILNSPSNPTGKVCSSKEIKEIISLVSKHGFYIITDEIYEKFYYQETASLSILPSPFGLYERVILLNGFSKSHSMTGWRIGYAIGPREIIQQMSNLQQYTFVCSPSVAQKMVLLAYGKQVTAILNEQVAKYLKKRNYVYETLKNDFHFSKAEGAFYFFIECPWRNGDEFSKVAIKKNLLIVPGKVFSEKDTHFRLSFAVKDEVLKKGCELLIELTSEFKKN